MKNFVSLILIVIIAFSTSSCGNFKKYFWGKSPKGSGVEKILVIKSIRKMFLMDGKNRVVKRYKIAIGQNPIGHKKQEGDNRTPEGVYYITHRNPQSQFYLSLHISYPNAEDIRQAKERGVSPGGHIMIHGLRNGSGSEGYRIHKSNDTWTAGCIAVTNEEIKEIWDLVEDGTIIVIRP